MKVYGFTVLDFSDGEVPTTSTRVFATKELWEIELDRLKVTEDQEIDTFETFIEGK